MKFYLKYINPAIALVILALCIWAGGTEKSSFDLAGIVEGGLGSYFFAKGLFCSAALFLSGMSLLRRWEGGNHESLYGSRDVGFVVAIAIALVGCFAGLNVKLKADAMRKSETANQPVQNPPSIELSEIATVPASQFLSITGKVKNHSAVAWGTVELDAEIFHGSVFSGVVHAKIVDLKPEEDRRFVLRSDELRTDKILDSLRYKVDVAGSVGKD